MFVSKPRIIKASSKSDMAVILIATIHEVNINLGVP